MNRWGMSLEGLGSLVSDLSDTQMMKYLERIKQFNKIIGRYPDYFEERDIIIQAKKEK